mmetsp:Transcript_91847/g.230806  ORF Transcript_91847/g.230806 Transcript_91847/m.230806 type:complete len:333 (-) Transcript_91847:154-1152(-)
MVMPRTYICVLVPGRGLHFHLDHPLFSRECHPRSQQNHRGLGQNQLGLALVGGGRLGDGRHEIFLVLLAGNIVLHHPVFLPRHSGRRRAVPPLSMVLLLPSSLRVIGDVVGSVSDRHCYHVGPESYKRDQALGRVVAQRIALLFQLHHHWLDHPCLGDDQDIQLAEVLVLPESLLQQCGGGKAPVRARGSLILRSRHKDGFGRLDERHHARLLHRITIDPYLRVDLFQYREAHLRLPPLHRDEETRPRRPLLGGERESGVLHLGAVRIAHDRGSVLAHGLLFQWPNDHCIYVIPPDGVHVPPDHVNGVGDAPAREVDEKMAGGQSRAQLPER